MLRPQPLIAVTDVEASSRWYRQLLGVVSDHGGPVYERLTHDGVLVLQLHSFGEHHDHGAIGDPHDRPYGNGALLWFEIADLDAALARAQAMGVEIILPRHRNPPQGDGGPNHWECWMRDPDGYTVVLASPDGSADGDWRPGDDGADPNDAWQSRSHELVWQFGKDLKALHTSNPWPEQRLLDQAMNTLMTELWDNGFSQTEIRQAFEGAIADMPRYAARVERRP